MSDSEKKSFKDKLSQDILRKYASKIAWRRETRLKLRGDFDEKYPEDIITAFLLSGFQFFDRDTLRLRKLELTNFKPFQTFDNGNAHLFWPRIPGRRYLIGADPGTGRMVSTDNIDRSAAVVLDLETGEEMAGYAARVTPHDFAYDLDDLGRYYNYAPIAVERTGDGGAVMLTLQGECQYPSIVKYKEWYKRTRDKVIELEGFPTTPKTRPVALNMLSQFVMEKPHLIWDTEFINEAMVFVRDEKGKPQAMAGAHDDRVSARWIAHAIRQMLLGYWNPLNAKREAYVDPNRQSLSATL